MKYPLPAIHCIRDTILLLVHMCLSLLIIATPHAHASNNDPAAVEVVKAVNLKRYTGKWYEIALIPVWFQKDCDSGATAEYSLREDGDIDVVNRCCTRKGKLKEVKGRAWIVEKSNPAKLKVGFFSVLGFWPFKGDYWIIDLDPDYRYVVIGHPSRKLGWIMSRTPELAPHLLHGIAERLQENGYDYSSFTMTNQTEVPCSR